MRTPLTVDVVIRALAEELAAALGGKLGGQAANALAEFAPETGWLAALDVSGTVRGSLTVWFGRESAGELARVALGGTSVPADDALGAWLAELIGRAAAAMAGRAALEGTVVGDVEIGTGAAPAGALAFETSLPDRPNGVLVIGAQVTVAGSSIGAGDARLEAVLDVDLPLVVRFGRAVMPLRALADLGPGSVVDMGRSPDEPVELLVGERLIARGEVVIVAGNYGVRITELMTARPQLSDLEARTS
jgi:flagellar motor switch protein FliN/FliY